MTEILLWKYSSTHMTLQWVLSIYAKIDTVRSINDILNADELCSTLEKLAVT